MSASSNRVDDSVIDPVLLPRPPPVHGVVPSRASTGELEPEDSFKAVLEAIKEKKALQDSCVEHDIPFRKKNNLAQLRELLLRHWYPLNDALAVTPPRRGRVQPAVPQSTSASGDLTSLHSLVTSPGYVGEDDVGAGDDDDRLVERYGAEGAEDLLGYDGDGLDEDEDEELDLNDPAQFLAFKTRTSTEAAIRSEANRRKGGRKTQNSVIFARDALAKSQIRDMIVDTHSLLLFIKWCAERPKRNRRGEEIPGTLIGASQIKKMFFGVLRIRKVQDARDPKLARSRPATSVVVYDAVKTRMDEALERARSGLIPGEDAPDIVANTFLDRVTAAQLQEIGFGFLEHRELKMVINGHLAWTCQNASGNRGDDIRSLRLSELQPYTFLHPNLETPVYCVLGLQGEEKAGRKGMKTTINPSYTTWIAHRDPIACPLGAIAFYQHFLHDKYKLTEKMEIDWEINKSWRQASLVRFLFGSSPVQPYNESNLYNLYCQAYKKAGFESNIKQHLPRHMLGYLQEQLGVDANETARLGWNRGTYFSVYAPALPKPAILGSHGYKEHEVYDPIWRHVRVPELFLALVCPMAESTLALIEGKKNLSGASNYWQMIIELRPYLFQCAAAIYQVRPNSALFKLPALARADVQEWMKTTFPSELAVLQAAAGNPVDMARIADAALRQSLEEMRAQLSTQQVKMTQMMQLMERRTAVLSPAKGYSNAAYAASFNSTVSEPSSAPLDDDPFLVPPPGASCTPPRARMDPPTSIDQSARASEDTGVYLTEDNGLRAFLCPSPVRPDAPRPRTEVDWVLPPLAAFNDPDCHHALWPPILGQHSVQPLDIFKLVRQPRLLFEAWKPTKTLDIMDLETLWASWNAGEAVVNVNGEVTGMKPPLRSVEQHFSSKWRSEPKARKWFQHYREIPDYIDAQVSERRVTPDVVICELEAMRTTTSDSAAHPLGTRALARHIATMRKAKAASALASDASVSSMTSSPISAANNSGKKRRAPTIGGRAKPKKVRVNAE